MKILRTFYTMLNLSRLGEFLFHRVYLFIHTDDIEKTFYEKRDPF